MLRSRQARARLRAKYFRRAAVHFGRHCCERFAPQSILDGIVKAAGANRFSFAIKKMGVVMFSVIWFLGTAHLICDQGLARVGRSEFLFGRCVGFLGAARTARHHYLLRYLLRLELASLLCFELVSGNLIRAVLRLEGSVAGAVVWVDSFRGVTGASVAVVWKGVFAVPG